MLFFGLRLPCKAHLLPPQMKNDSCGEPLRKTLSFCPFEGCTSHCLSSLRFIGDEISGPNNEDEKTRQGCGEEDCTGSLSASPEMNHGLLNYYLDVLMLCYCYL